MDVEPCGRRVEQQQQQQHVKTTAISRVSGVEVQRLLYKLDRAAPFLPVTIPRHAAAPIAALSSSPSSTTTCGRSGKHGSQLESIVAHMRRYGILLSSSSSANDDDTIDANDHQACCFIEFGCGTAKLSDYLSQSLSNETNHASQRNSNSNSLQGRTGRSLQFTTSRHCAANNDQPQSKSSPHQFILIDRQTFGRDKIRDGAIRARSRRVQRITQDIGTVHLASLLNLPSPPPPLLLPVLNATVPPRTSSGTNSTIVPSSLPTTTTTTPPLRLVALSKHLCAVAVEYTMQCILDYCWAVDAKEDTTTTTTGSGSSSSSSSGVEGGTTMIMPRPPQWHCLYQQSLRRRPLIPMAIATCCHYSCREEFMRHPRLDDDETSAATTATTTDWFHQLGFTSRDWHVLATISQWASLRLEDETTMDQEGTTSFATGTSSWYETVQDHSSDYSYAPFPPPVPKLPLPCALDTAVEARFVPSDEFERHYGRRDKQALGVRCKIVLDTARAHRLRDMGYANVALLAYTTESVEQNLLMAIP